MSLLKLQEARPRGHYTQNLRSFKIDQRRCAALLRIGRVLCGNERFYCRDVLAWDWVHRHVVVFW